MNLSYLLNPPGSGTNQDDNNDNDKDPSKSDKLSISTSNANANSSSTGIKASTKTPDDTPKNASSLIHAETDLSDGESTQATGKRDNIDHNDARRGSQETQSRDLQSQEFPTEIVIKSWPLHRNSFDRGPFSAPSRPSLPRNDREHQYQIAEPVSTKRKQQSRSAKPPWNPSRIESPSSGSGSNSNGGNDTSSSSSGNNNASRSENKVRSDSFKRGKIPSVPDASAKTTDTETEPAPLQPNLERTADGKFRCNWPRCGKEFTVAARLLTHFRIHLGKPPYLCGYKGCEKAFHTSSSLSHHRVIHTDQGLRPYVCRHDRCGATYTQLARLITHQRSTHSGSVLFISQEAASASASSAPSSPLSATSPNPLLSSAAVAQSQQNNGEFLYSASSSAPSTPSYPDRRRSYPPPYGHDHHERDGGNENENEDVRLRREAALTMASFSTMATIHDTNRPAPIHTSSADETLSFSRYTLATGGPQEYHPHSAPHDDRLYYRQNFSSPMSQPTSPRYDRRPHSQGFFSPEYSPTPSRAVTSPDQERQQQQQPYAPQHFSPRGEYYPTSPGHDYRRNQALQGSSGDSYQALNSPNSYYRRERGYFDSLYSNDGLSPPPQSSSQDRGGGQPPDQPSRS